MTKVFLTILTSIVLCLPFNQASAGYAQFTSVTNLGSISTVTQNGSDYYNTVIGKFRMLDNYGIPATIWLNNPIQNPPQYVARIHGTTSTGGLSTDCQSKLFALYFAPTNGYYNSYVLIYSGNNIWHIPGSPNSWNLFSSPTPTCTLVLQ